MDANERRERATNEASIWWQRLGTRSPVEISAADREQFTQWLRESPLHVAEMLHIAHVHDTLERCKLWKEVSTDPVEEEPNIVPLRDSDNVVLPARDGVQSQPARTWARRRPNNPARNGFMKFVAMAAAVVAIAALVLLPQLNGQVIATARAERREVMLNDGSVVQLEPQTILRINLKEHERHVTLEQGRALFHVAKDKARPFLVATDNTVVRAVGTAFGVERQSNNVVVTVAEGKVAVLTGDARRADGATSVLTDTQHQGATTSLRNAGAAPIFLSANQQIIIPSSGVAEPTHEVDTTRALAWAEGRLVFDSTPLSEVVEEFNRYNHVQLHISGAELTQRRVSGVFQASDIDTLIAFIRAGVRVNVVRNAQQILITPAR